MFPAIQESFSRGISWCPGDKPCSELPPLKGTSVSAIAEAKQAPNLADNVVNKKAQQTEEGQPWRVNLICQVLWHGAPVLSTLSEMCEECL